MLLEVEVGIGGAGEGVGMERLELYRSTLLQCGYIGPTGVYCCQRRITISIRISLLSGYIAIAGKYCSRRVTSLSYKYITYGRNIIAIR